jgi:hypothetical protein
MSLEEVNSETKESNEGTHGHFKKAHPKANENKPKKSPEEKENSELFLLSTRNGAGVRTSSSSS